MSKTLTAAGLFASLSLFGLSSFANNAALAEFEDQIAAQRHLYEEIESGRLVLPFKVQQYDEKATEVKPNTDFQDYKKAVMDPFYGYQVFILVDKSVSRQSGKSRDGDNRTPQTLYVYARSGNILKLQTALPVSTGKEPKPGISDTREGFMRVQSAQATYVSRKYGEAMPFSLWFESEYGTAIHQTLQSRCDSLIGRRASAGCIRLCPGDAERLFRFVTDPQYPRTSPIVLLDKRTGIPVKPGTPDKKISLDKDSRGSYLSAPKVIRGYPAFVRIIDGNSPEKIREIENIIQNPTEGFLNYFRPFADEALDPYRT